MSLTAKLQDITVNETVLRESCEVIVEGDVIVPDVKGDILKVLTPQARVEIESCELSGRKANIKGCVYVDILYIPAGGGKIDAIHSAHEFLHSVKAEGDTENMYADVSADVVSCEGSVYNSRKLNVKTSVNLGIKIHAERSVNMLCDCEGEVEKQFSRVQHLERNVAFNDSVPVRETFQIPSGMPNIMRVLKYEAAISECDYKILTNKVVAKGEIKVKVLYMSVNETIEFCEHTFAFTEILDVGGINDELDSNIKMSLCRLNVNSDEDDDGDMRMLCLDARLNIEIKACSYSTIDIVSDIFSTAVSLETDYNSFSYMKAGEQNKSSVPIKETVTIPEGAPAVRQIYNVSASPRVKSATPDGSRVNVEGRMDVDILYLCEDEQAPVYMLRREVEFSQTVDFENTVYGDCNASVGLQNFSYNITPGGDIEIRGALDLTVQPLENVTVNYIRSVNENEMPEGDMRRASLVIYFAQKNDTLWDISKNYLVPQERISNANQLIDGHIKAGQRIVIPR